MSADSMGTSAGKLWIKPAVKWRAAGFLFNPRDEMCIQIFKYEENILKLLLQLSIPSSKLTLTDVRTEIDNETQQFPL